MNADDDALLREETQGQEQERTQGEGNKPGTGGVKRKKKRQSSKRHKKAEREQGWIGSAPITETMPEYNALRDPYCTFAQSSALSMRFRNQQSKYQVATRKLNKNLVRVREQQRKDDALVDKLDTPAATAGVDKEIIGMQRDIIELILEREGVLETLQSVAQVSPVQVTSLGEILALLRKQSLHVVESIAEWRRKCGREDRVFLYRGCNYLLKIMSDLNFLADSKDVASKMNMAAETLRNNPFISPYTLLPDTVGDLVPKPAAVSPRNDGTCNQGGQVEETRAEGAPKSEEHQKVDEYKAGTGLEERMKAAEQVLIREIRNNDIRAIKRDQKNRLEEDSPPADPSAFLSIWREFAKGQVKDLAQVWGLPQSFPEVQELGPIDTKTETLNHPTGNLMASTLGLSPSAASKNKLKRGPLGPVKIIYSKKPWDLTPDKIYRASTSIPSDYRVGACRRRKENVEELLSKEDSFLESWGTLAADKGNPGFITIPAPMYSYVGRVESHVNCDAASGYKLSAEQLFALGSQDDPVTAITLVVAAALIVLTPGKAVPSVLRWEVLRESLTTGKGTPLLLELRDRLSCKIPSFKIAALVPFLTDQRFVPDELARHYGQAVAALCSWVINAVCSKPKNRKVLSKLLLPGAVKSSAASSPKAEVKVNASNRQAAKEEEEEEGIVPGAAVEPDEPPVNLADVVLAEHVYSFTIEKPGAVYSASFFLTSVPRGGLLLKCYEPSTERSGQLLFTQKERVALEKKLHTPSCAANQNELKLFCKRLRGLVSLSPVASEGLRVVLEGHASAGSNEVSRWTKVLGTNRTFGARVYAISVYTAADLSDATEGAGSAAAVADLLFKVKDAKDQDARHVSRLVRHPEAAAVLYYQKQLFNGSTGVQGIVEELLKNISVERSSGSDQVTCTFRRCKPLHNPRGLEHPERPDVVLDLHDQGLEALLESAPPAQGARQKQQPNKVKVVTKHKQPVPEKSSTSAPAMPMGPTVKKPVQTAAPALSAKPAQNVGAPRAKTAQPALREQIKLPAKIKSQAPPKSASSGTKPSKQLQPTMSSPEIVPPPPNEKAPPASAAYKQDFEDEGDEYEDDFAGEAKSETPPRKPVSEENPFPLPATPAAGIYSTSDDEDSEDYGESFDEDTAEAKTKPTATVTDDDDKEEEEEEDYADDDFVEERPKPTNKAEEHADEYEDDFAEERPKPTKKAEEHAYEDDFE